MSNRFTLTSIACVYGGYVLTATLYPFECSPHLFQSFVNSLRVPKPPNATDFIENVLLFIPLGMVLYYRFASGKKCTTPVMQASIVGGAFSILIEVLQLIFIRHSSAFDILANTLGSGCGASLSALMPRQVTEVAHRLCASRRALAIAVSFGLLNGAVPLFSSIVQFTEPFRIWNSGFEFQLGNEASLNRPWVGKLYSVALYSRALALHEIEGNFDRGFAAALATRRVDERLIALYTFDEGTGDIVHDVSGTDPPLDLHISPMDHVGWLEPNGIEIVQPAIVRSRGGATKISQGVRATQELTMEVWLAPRNTSQRGPARIMSFSRDAGTRNFMLGQEGSNVNFRLRTPVTGTNGAALALKTTSGLLAPERFHLVATYKDGVQKLYANGVEQPEIVNLRTDGIVAFATRKTAFARGAYSFFYFFPVSFLLAAFSSTRSTAFVSTLLVPFAIGAGLLASTEMFQTFAFDRGIDFSLLVCGSIIAAMGALTGRAVVQDHPFLSLS